MSGYTKGPWKQRFDESVCIVDVNENAIAYTDTFLPREECIANARLMAAAPELLQMLKTVRRTLLEAGGDPMPTMDALIAKAESL